MTRAEKIAVASRVYNAAREKAERIYNAAMKEPERVYDEAMAAAYRVWDAKLSKLESGETGEGENMIMTYNGLKASIVSQRKVMMIHGNSSEFNQGYIQALDEIAQRCEYYEKKKLRKKP